MLGGNGIRAGLGKGARQAHHQATRQDLIFTTSWSSSLSIHGYCIPWYLRMDQSSDATASAECACQTSQTDIGQCDEVIGKHHVTVADRGIEILSLHVSMFSKGCFLGTYLSASSL